MQKTEAIPGGLRRNSLLKDIMQKLPEDRELNLGPPSQVQTGSEKSPLTPLPPAPVHQHVSHRGPQLSEEESFLQ